LARPINSDNHRRLAAVPANPGEVEDDALQTADVQ